MSQSYSRGGSAHKEQGAVLLIGLVFLVILMVGAVSLMNATVSDEKMTGNSKASAEAFFAAEAGHRQVTALLAPQEDPDDEATTKKRKQEAKALWDTLYAELHHSKYKTPEEWNQRNGNPQLPDDFSPKGEHSFALSVAPVFRAKRDSAGNVVKDADNNPIMERVENRIQFVSTGEVGRSTRAIGFELDGGGGDTGFQAPAAISCFGPCIVIAGTANDAPISGRNHPVPADEHPDDEFKHCTGKGCDEDAYSTLNDDPDNGIKNHFSVPAIYLTEPESDNNTVQVGKNGKPNDNKLAFEGQDKSKKELENADQYHVAGNSIDADSVWFAADYEDMTDEEGNPKEPKRETFFGEDGIVPALEEKAGSTIGPVGSSTITKVDTATTDTLDVGSAGGVLIIDGAGGEFGATGTGIFSGLIIIKGCNQWTSSGNITVYGAIIVDAEGCPEGYTPFAGNGTPDVKYSADALGTAGVGTGTGQGLKKDWYEIVNY